MSEAAEVVPGYHSAVNEIIEPDKVLVLTRYFVRRWMPALGDNGTRIVLALRSLGYYNRQTGEKRNGIEIDLPELAAMCGISVPTLKREFGERHDKSRAAIPGSLQNPALHQFVKKDRQYWRDPVTNRLLRTANVYRVMMDDPIHEDDLPKLQEVLTAREKGAQPSKAQNEPKPPKGRASSVPSKAQSESKKNESESKATHFESKPCESESPDVESEPALIDDFSSLQNTFGTSSDAAAPDFSASLFSEEVQDVLDALLPEQWTELEAKARARVIAESADPVRRLAREGKAWTSVKPMMRKILAQEDLGGTKR